MRLLLVTFTAKTRSTGVGRWTHQMADALSEKGHQVTLWFEEDFPRIRNRMRLEVLHFPLALAARLIRHRHDFDAILVHEPSAFWYAAARRLVSSLPPVLVMSHGVESKVFSERAAAAKQGAAEVPLSSRIKTPLFRLWQSDGALKLADHVLCLSTADAAYVEKALGVPSSRITPFVNGVSEEFFVERAHAGAPAKVLFVGSWIDRKGNRLLPALWQRVLADNPEAKLTLVGTGFGKEAVLGFFSPQVRHSVTVIPHLSTANEMSGQYAEHAILVLPSLSEGSPLCLLEAMAAGLAPVASTAGGIPDIVRHGEEGLLFQPLDVDAGVSHLCRLLKHPEERDRLARNAQNRARQLTWMNAAERVHRAVGYAANSRLGG